MRKRLLVDIHSLRYDGGVGESTLTGCLIPLLSNPLLIEIGGNRARALKFVAETDRLHFSSSDPERFGNAIDARIENASRVAIIECEQSVYREAIEAAAVLRGEPYNSAVYVLIIVSKVDHKMGLVKLANQYGITDPIVFAQHGYRRERPME